MQHFVLDACAMIAFFRAEAGAERVHHILNKAAASECNVFMHNATVAELYYDAMKSEKQKEESVLQSLIDYPINFVDNITLDMIRSIGYFKTTFKISFADSFVLALAKLNNAKVVTSDHHEFDIIGKSGAVSFEWIR